MTTVNTVARNIKNHERTIKNEKENHTNYDSYGACSNDGINCNPICKCRNKQQRS